MSKTGTFIFGLVFAAVGFGFLFFQTLPSLIEQHKMKSWQAVDASVMNTKLETHRGDDSTTYKVTGSYRYEWQGHAHTNDRISIHGGSDNLGSYHQDRHRELQNAMNNNQNILVYVNPDAPHEAIYDREVRWGKMLFGLVFVFVFGGAGIGVCLYSIFGKRKFAKNIATSDDRPWRQNPDWQGDALVSSAKSGMYMTIIGALIWNAFSWPIASMVIVEEGLHFPAILVALFPLVGLLILFFAYKKLKNWLKYGRTPLVLDPFPGAIGGNVGGYIEINQAWKADRHYKVTITCLYSYVSGTGKNRSRKEKLVWQEPGYADSNSYNNKTRLKFRFEIPEKLPASDAIQGETYHLWRLGFSCADKGADIERHYEIPVYPTGQMSQIAYPLSKDHPALQEHTLDAIESFLNIERKGSALSIHMSLGKRVKTAAITLLVSLIVTGSLAAIYRENAHLVLLVFLVISALVCLLALFASGKSRTALIGQSGIQVKTFFFGLPISSKEMTRADCIGIEKHSYMSSSSAHNHREHFQIRAKGRDKNKLVLAERLLGQHEADQLLESIKTLTGYR